MSDYLVVLVTANSEEQARKIAGELLEKRLIACANLIPVRSLFIWQDQVQDEAEVLMIIKATHAIFKDKLQAEIKRLHSYEVPEIIGMPIVIGSVEYLKWIGDNVTGL
ncbi:MAG: divalent-cation tolerance protein CutA [Anaerolineae bacterium]|nr:divalent-cation tolerance protein CutA [Anaerolineae bacterium]